MATLWRRFLKSMADGTAARARYIGIWLAIGIFPILVAGCTRTVIYQADGEVQVQNRFGVTHLMTQPGTLPQIIQTDGLGISSREGALSIGYFSAEVAVLPIDDCRIVVWLDKDATSTVREELKALGDSVCVVGPGAQKLLGRVEQ